MQAQESSATSIDPPENRTISESLPDDANRLEQKTLDASDCIHPSPNFNFQARNHSDLTDEDAALAAHLRDRHYASDPDQYEWDSEDLVSSASSDGENTSDEGNTRLARKDEFEQGIRRDRTRTGEYREQWEEDHIFYKQKLQAHLEAEDHEEYERHSYVSEGAWSGQTDQLDCGTPATSGSVKSKEAWRVEDSWDERKAEEEESWNSNENLQRQYSHNADGGVSNSTSNDGKILSSFLDTCIDKTHALLVNASEALNSVANIDQTCEPDDDALTDEQLQNPLTRNATINTKPEPKDCKSRIPLKKNVHSTIAMYESYAEAGPSQTSWQSEGKVPAVRSKLPMKAKVPMSTALVMEPKLSRLSWRN